MRKDLRAYKAEGAWDCVQFWPAAGAKHEAELVASEVARLRQEVGIQFSRVACLYRNFKLRQVPLDALWGQG